MRARSNRLRNREILLTYPCNFCVNPIAWFL
jgi:hypothetical protein